jgi:hypothetical protein
MKECSICFDNIILNQKILKCKHSFHKSCIETWINEKGTCPVCRAVENPLVHREESSEVYHAVFRFINR